MYKIDEIPDLTKVLLMRRTGFDTVKTDVGYKDGHGNIRGWGAKGAPTHWVPLPEWADDKEARLRKQLHKG